MEKFTETKHMFLVVPPGWIFLSEIIREDESYFYGGRGVWVRSVNGDNAFSDIQFSKKSDFFTSFPVKDLKFLKTTVTVHGEIMPGVIEAHYSKKIGKS